MDIPTSQRKALQEIARRVAAGEKMADVEVTYFDFHQPTALRLTDPVLLHALERALIQLHEIYNAPDK